MKIVAIIPARGGSKRIPRKNIREFCGKPMVAYSVEAALASGVFDEVMVSTDDREIAEIAVRYGASVPFMRSAETSGDFVNMPDVVIEVLEEYEKRGCHYDYGCMIFPTAPFVSAENLKKAGEKFREAIPDSLVSVVKFSYPVQRALVMREGQLVFEYPQYLDSRSQDLEPHYHDAAQFIFFRTESLKTNRRLLVGNMLPFEIDEMQVQDIDTEEDWKIAEMKYRMVKEKQGE